MVDWKILTFAEILKIIIDAETPTKKQDDKKNR